jgi:hypothetical protein
MKGLKIIFLALITGLASCSLGQTQGCTNENALNFEENAITNDGSCLYPYTSYIPEKINDLPQDIKEVSGLIQLNNGFWTLNDSGNSPELFLLDTNNYTIVRSVYIKNALNIDWEELTVSENHVFIGDFGNNSGTRSNLRVLKLEKSLLLNSSIDSIEVDEINFSYPDQNNFNSSNDHNFDCEAFIYKNDSLHLFSKNRGNEFTKLYTIPSLPGNYIAHLKDSCHVEGQITGAHIQGDTLIGLLGYRPNSFYEPFMFLLWDYNQNNFFTGNKRRVNLGTVMDLGQNESIHFSGNHKGFIASEEITQMNKKAAVYEFGIAHLFENQLNIMDDQSIYSDSLQLFPNPNKGKMTIISESKPVREAFLLDTAGKIVYHRAFGSQGKNKAVLKINNLSEGNYFLQIKLIDTKSIIKKVIIQ